MRIGINGFCLKLINSDRQLAFLSPKPCGEIMFGKFFSAKSSKDNVPAETEQVILEVLRDYRSEAFPLGILAIVQDTLLQANEQEVCVRLTMPFPCHQELQTLADSLTDSLNTAVRFDVSLDIKPVRQHDIKGVSNIIAVASGKGGVGKSTTAVNLAYALMAEGARVGILDADIYGPSIPTMLGVKDQRPTSKDGKTMTPIDADGLAAMSIGFLVPDEEATVWRGPMASSAFAQLLNETDWPELDYLIIDMPPGTGDIQLTLAQKVPVAAAVVVTTPQNVALADAVKGITMFDKVKVPVLGVIENMSYHKCENCGHQSHLFGHDGGKNIASDHQTLLLGQLPLNVEIRESADLGNCAQIKNSTGDMAQVYRRIARHMAGQLFLQLDMRSPQTAKFTINDE